MNNFERRALRRAYERMAAELEPNLFITHNFGTSFKAETQMCRMTHFYNLIQGKAFGRRWAKDTARPWPTAIGFREHPDSNAHYHVLLKACPGITSAIQQHGEEIWGRLCSRGQLWTENTADTARVISYCTKALAGDEALENVFVYGDNRRTTCP